MVVRITDGGSVGLNDDIGNIFTDLINDRDLRLEKSAMTPIINEDSMELGYGNMDLEGMKKIAFDNEVEAIILESHKNRIDKDPLKSLELSAGWFGKNGI